MKRRLRIMKKLSKEGITMHTSQRGIHLEEMYFQEDFLPPCIKEDSIIVNETI
jgi:hypothetical protein